MIVVVAVFVAAVTFPGTKGFHGEEAGDVYEQLHEFHNGEDGEADVQAQDASDVRHKVLPLQRSALLSISRVVCALLKRN